jgi:hypothetical protein
MPGDLIDSERSSRWRLGSLDLNGTLVVDGSLSLAVESCFSSSASTSFNAIVLLTSTVCLPPIRVIAVMVCFPFVVVVVNGLQRFGQVFLKLPAQQLDDDALAQGFSLDGLMCSAVLVSFIVLENYRQAVAFDLFGRQSDALPGQLAGLRTRRVLASISPPGRPQANGSR